MHGQHHRVNADPVGHEVGRVLGVDHALAQKLAELRHALHDGWVRLGRLGDLEQAHVTHRIEEVQNQEA
jgi:hypothetical protein